LMTNDIVNFHLACSCSIALSAKTLNNIQDLAL